MFPKPEKKKTAREIYHEAMKESRKSRAKYGNTSSLCALGHSHRSKLESSVCGMLHLRERAKEISEIQAEVTVHLMRARIAYIADFKCRDIMTGEELFIEAKGMDTAVWRIKGLLDNMKTQGGV